MDSAPAAPRAASRLPVSPSVPGDADPGALGTGARWLAYAILAAALLWAVLASLRQRGVDALLGEGGLIELVQLGLLGGGVVGLLLASRSHRARHGLVLVALLAVLALVRELDGPLDVLLFHGSWKLATLVVLALSTGLGAPHLRELPSSLARLARSPAAGLLLAAGLMVAVQSRLIGMQVVWRGAFGDAFDRSAPRLAEELVELGGYSIFLLAALELLVESRGDGRAAEARAGRGANESPRLVAGSPASTARRGRVAGAGRGPRRSHLAQEPRA